jgi:hypothetical protein
MIFFFNLADFSYLKEEEKKRRLLDMVRTGKKWTFFKADADGFRYFSMIFQLFYFLTKIILGSCGCMI